MKPKISKKFFGVVASWFLILTFLMVIPTININCGVRHPFLSTSPEEEGSDFNIRLNGGTSKLGDGGNGGGLEIDTSGGTGSVDVGVGNPGIPTPPDASGAPTTSSCLIQGTRTFASLDTGPGSDCDNAGVAGDWKLDADVPIIIDGILTVNSDAYIRNVTVANLDINITKRGQIICSNPTGNDLEIFASGNLYIQGLIDTSGADSDTAHGETGGDVALKTDTTTAGGSGGSIILTGFIDTRGGNHFGTGTGSFSGGNGGDVGFIPDDDGTAPASSVAILGQINTSGGRSTDTAAGANGGDAGDVGIDGQNQGTDEVIIFIAGDIIANGGDSLRDLGGDSGDVEIETEPAGAIATGNPVYLTGSIRSNGGTGNGGAGKVEIETQNGEIVLASDIEMNGGDTLPSSLQTDAGDGGGIYLKTTGALDGDGSVILVGGDGNIQANGGDGLTCGGNCEGGVIGIVTGDSGSINTNGILQALGGAETSGGGSAGTGGSLDISVSNGPLAGTITNNMEVEANGGPGAHTGGAGGYVELEADTGSIVNNGGFSLMGGPGVQIGGEAGYVSMFTDDSGSDTGGPITNNGNINTSGGNGGVTGGTAGALLFTTSNATPGAGDITNNGNLTAKGGDAATGNGGSGDANDNTAYPIAPCSTGYGLGRTICFNSDLYGNAVASGVSINGATLSAKGGSGPVSDGVAGDVEITASDELAGNDDSGTVSVTNSNVQCTGSAPGTIILTEDDETDGLVTSTAGTSFNPAPVLN